MSTDADSEKVPPGCFASAFELDPTTQDVMVVLMSREENGYALDWNAAYMLPSSVVKATCRTDGVFQMVWNDAWQSRMSERQWHKSLHKANKSIHEWLADEGVSQVRGKQQQLRSCAETAKDRLKNLFEGQLVLFDGTVAEVRGLEKDCGEDNVCVLRYTHVSMDSSCASASTWRLEHHTRVEVTARSNVNPVDWSWDASTVTVTVHIV